MKILNFDELALAQPAPEAYDHGPQAATIAEALRDVSKWLNERPNHPLDLRHVAMLCAALKDVPVVEPDAIGCKCSICGEWQRWTPSGMVCKNGHGGADGINHRLYTSPTPPAEAQPAPARPGVFGYLDEQVRKDMAGFYGEFVMRQPPPPVPLLTDGEIDVALHAALPSLSFASEAAFIEGVRVGEELARQKAGL